MLSVMQCVCDHISYCSVPHKIIILLCSTNIDMHALSRVSAGRACDRHVAMVSPRVRCGLGVRVHVTCAPHELKLNACMSNGAMLPGLATLLIFRLLDKIIFFTHTVEPLYEDTPEMNEDISLDQDTMHGPSYIDMCTKSIPKMRTSPLIRTLYAVPRVSGIEGFHCTAMYDIILLL